MSDQKHAILSPSGADRWMTCLGSVALTKDLPEQTSEYAVDGTDHHEVAAVCLEELCDAADLVGRPMLSGAILTEENAKYLQDGYIDPVRTLAEGGTLLVEERVPISHLTGEKDAEGTADTVVIREDRELIIGDLKFGRGVEVSPEHNRQEMIYALGVIEKHDLKDQVDQVRLIIFQPRTGDGKPKEWVVSMMDLLAFGEEVKKAAETIRTPPNRILTTYPPQLMVPQLPLTPSEKACRFCKARATCPALKAFVEGALTDGFTPADTSNAELCGAVVDGEALGAAMDKTDLVEIWMKAVRAAVEVELLAGRPVVGGDGPYKLVQGRKGNRAWLSKEDAEALLKSFRLKKDQMYNMTVISPADADKLLAKENPKRWKQCLEIITQSEGSKHVAKATDKRPALVVEAPEAGFDVVEAFDDLL